MSGTGRTSGGKSIQTTDPPMCRIDGRAVGVDADPLEVNVGQRGLERPVLAESRGELLAGRVVSLRAEVDPLEPHDPAAAGGEALGRRKHRLGGRELEREAPAEDPSAHGHARDHAPARPAAARA